MIKIGLHSDDARLQLLLPSALGQGFALTLAQDEEEMSSLCADGGCDVMILDLTSSQTSLQERIDCSRRLIGTKVPAVIMSDDAMASTAHELVKLGGFGYCRTPPSIRNLKTLLSQAYESRLLKEQHRSMQHQMEAPANCDRMIGCSTQMLKVYELVKRVANINASVLITGESGTGKELIARAIHNLGSRASRPFVAVSCGAIPETLIEAELFGHEKGAFTGAVGTREGYFEQAGDGTLFLDEIGDLSLSTQVKLLRVLQEMEFNRLGSSRYIPLRARMVFATHRDLSKLVAEGKFRQDLYYRINVMRIISPSLRDRADDIPAIATHYLRHYAQMFEKPMDDLEPEAMAVLQSNTWPGNVRELENVIQRAIILAPHRTIRVEDLPLIQRDECMDDIPSVFEIGDYNPDGSFERQVRNYKMNLVASAVRDNHGNKTIAARSLCISRAYLHRLILLAEADPIVAQTLKNEAVA